MLPFQSFWVFRFSIANGRGNFPRVLRSQGIRGSVTIHQKSLQYLFIEIYKVKKGISPIITNEFFQFFENSVYELRSGVHIPTRNSRTVFFGTESIINLGAKLWNMVPVNIKSSESLNIVKSKIKYWTPNHSPCRNCKTYIGQVGFVN